MKETADDHPTDDEVHSFARGELSDEEMHRIACHVQVCDVCTDRVDRVSVSLDSLVEGVRHETASDSPNELEQGPSESQLPELPERYRIESLLGSGGFGEVYLASDLELGRHVAIKVPLARRIRRHENAEEFVAEARLLARLDHPGIVPVYDAGRCADGCCFVVYKHIPGRSLADLMQDRSLTEQEAARLVTTVSAALHYAHLQGVVHRDIKPSNLLLDSGGSPLVADFGLALQEQDFGIGHGWGGTPAYMSPEQARGEGNRVDGRSDVYSLGVVLYELLTGRRPFSNDGPELLKHIAEQEARPLRQINDKISPELERICLRALANRLHDRYTTALDFATDLSAFVKSEQVESEGRAPQAFVTPQVEPTPEELQGKTRLAKENLEKGERIIYAARTHPLVFISSSVLASSGLFTFFALYFVSGLGSRGSLSASWPYLAIWIVLFSGRAIKAGIDAFTTEFVLTDRRVIASTGFLEQSTFFSNVSDTEAQVRQDAIGRMFDFGTVTVSDGRTSRSFSGIRCPFVLKGRLGGLQGRPG